MGGTPGGIFGTTPLLPEITEDSNATLMQCKGSNSLSSYQYTTATSAIKHLSYTAQFME
jgi:hypothetical protein